jgi:hypothetical protein
MRDPNGRKMVPWLATLLLGVILPFAASRPARAQGVGVLRVQKLHLRE